MTKDLKYKVITAILVSLVVFIILTLYMKTTARAQDINALDDVSPGITCEQGLIDNADIIFVIPFYENSILTKEWCDTFKDKEIGLHGLHHTQWEFASDINEAELVEAISLFEDCFGKKPTKFRPPMWKINDYNKALLDKYDLQLMNNPLETSTYHCNNRGFIFSIIGIE